jgi:hypothetical protein
MSDLDRLCDITGTRLVFIRSFAVLFFVVFILYITLVNLLIFSSQSKVLRVCVPRSFSQPPVAT